MHVMHTSHLQTILMQGVSSDGDLQRAQQDLVSATEAAAANGPSSGVSAFAAPALQPGPASDVSQAKDLLGKVLETTCMDPAVVAELIPSHIRLGVPYTSQP